MVLLASFDADVGASGIIIPKSHVAPNFDYLDVRNAVMPFVIPLAIYNTNANTNGIT